MQDAWTTLGAWRGTLLKRIELLAEVDSTNGEALRRIDAGEPVDGTVLLACRQTQGHGSRGHRWHDLPGRSLAVTAIVVWPDGRPAALATWAAAVAVSDLLAALELPHRIKWPNDVLVRERKLAGVLAELRPGSPATVAIGIGINVGHAASELPADCATPPTSLALEGAVINVPDCALRLLAALDWRLGEALGSDPGRLRDRFLERTELGGRHVRATLPDRVVEGELRSLQLDGALEIGAARIQGGHVSALVRL